MKNFRSKFLVSTLILSAAVLTASANPVTFDFYKLGHGSGDFLPSDGVAATGGDLASSNVVGHIFNGDLNFTIGGITATATATYNQAVAAVVQDFESGWTSDRRIGAGLGVYHYASGSLDTSDDNITAGEVLTIKFSQVVNLTQIGLNNDGHVIFGTTNADKFYFNNVLMPLIGTTNLSSIGDTFTFAFAPNANLTLSPQFYLSSLTVSAVPDAGSTVAFIGAALVGLAAMRRKFGQA